MDAYAFPLLIKQLLVTPVAQRSRKEIVYRDDVRFVRASLERNWGEWPATFIRIYTVE